MKTKTCSKCKCEKPLEGFHRHKHMLYGRSSTCKLCATARAVAWAAENKVKRQEYLIGYRAANTDKSKEYAKAWKEKNPEALRAWRAENVERCREHHRKWVAENPQKNLESVRKSGAIYRKANPAKQRARYAAEKEMRKANSAAWYRANPEQHARTSAAWREANAEAYAATVRKARSVWAKRHPEKVNARNAARHARARDVTPTWASKVGIEGVYAQAARRTRETGIKHHVDHIVPLKHPLVQGLHCEANLQVISAIENVTKGNRYWPDMP